MIREEATRRIEAVLIVLADGGGDVVPLVTEFHVFGSYARGALNFGDIDVDVEYEVNEQRSLLEVRRMMYGRSPHADIRQALFQRQRIFQPHFRDKEGLQREFGDLVLLWRRGETLEQALVRLHAIAADPQAGRAARDPVVAELEELEPWIPRPIRNQLSEAATEGTITIERTQLDDAKPRSRQASTSIIDRWGATNPLRRAALAASWLLEELGVRGISADGPGWGALTADRGRVAVGLTPAQFMHAFRYLSEGHGDLWLQVVNPSRRTPLQAVLLRPHKLKSARGRE